MIVILIPLELVHFIETILNVLLHLQQFTNISYTALTLEILNHPIIHFTVHTHPINQPLTQHLLINPQKHVLIVNETK